MKKTRFNIPLYDIGVTLIQVESRDDKDEVERFMRQIKCQDEFIQEVRSYIEKGCIDGGETYRNLDMRKILVIFCPFKNDTIRAEVYSHEKRHIEDRVMEYMSVKDVESAGLLAGFLGKEFYKFWNLVHK